MPTMVPVSVPAWALLTAWRVSLNFSPRAWLRSWPKLGWLGGCRQAEPRDRDNGDGEPDAAEKIRSARHSKTPLRKGCSQKMGPDQCEYYNGRPCKDCATDL